MTNVPSEFYCPITYEIMRNPLMCRTGYNFERDTILNWLEEHNNTCPMTRNHMTVSDLVSNRALQARIQAWCESHNYNLSDNDENENDKPNQDDYCRPPEHRIITCLIKECTPKKDSVKKNKKTSRRTPPATTRGFLATAMPFFRRKTAVAANRTARA